LLWAVPPAAPSEEAPDLGPPTYYELAPSLVANLGAGGKYVRCEIQLMTRDPERLADIVLHAPAIRHELLMLLSEQDGGTLHAPAGKEALRDRALATVQGLMRELTGHEAIETIFFTAFFVQ
jgi:flagellar FliL protein